MKYINIAFLLFCGFQIQAQTQVDFYTTMGDFRVELREDLMPITAQNFIDLTEAEFYDGVIFHRVISGFVVQGGDPLGTGFGGPGYTIMDEYHPAMNHDSTGVIAMAKTSQPNSAGSQFYFSLDALPSLDETYAVFGSCIQNIEVIEAMGNVATGANDRPIVDIVMDSVRVVSGITSAVKKETQVVTIETFPNPFTESINLSYIVKTAGPVDILLLDIHGQIVEQLDSGYKSQGIHSMQFKTSSKLPLGSYILSIKTADGKGVKKLIRHK